MAERRFRCRDRWVTPVILVLFLVYSMAIGYRLHARSSFDRNNIGSTSIDKFLGVLNATTSNLDPMSVNSIKKNHPVKNFSEGNEDQKGPGFGHGTWIGKGSQALNDTPEMLNERSLRQGRRVKRANELMNDETIHKFEKAAITGSRSVDSAPLGNYTIWKNEYRSGKNFEDMLRLMQDQIIMERVYSGLAKMTNNLALHEELETQLMKLVSEEESTDIDHQQRVLDTIRDMGHILARASKQLYECKLVTNKLRAMLQTTEDELEYTQTYTTFLTQLASKALPDAIHCLTMRLTLEYYLLPLPMRNFPRRENLENPNLYHYALFSDKVLAASVVVNSTVVNAQDPSRHVFHIVTDKLNFGAMSMWFLLNPPGDATIHVQRFEDFAYPKYMSMLNHLRFYIPKIFPKLERNLFLDDDVVVQKDLTPLWSINRMADHSKLNEQDPLPDISSMVIGTVFLRAMNRWLLSNTPEYVTIQAQRFRDFARLDSSSEVLGQLESTVMKKLFYKTDSENRESSSNRLRCFFLKTFSKLERTLIPRDHFEFLWSIDQSLINDICRNDDSVLHLLVGRSAKVRAKPVEKNFELSTVAPQSNDKKKSIVPPRKPSQRLSLEPVIINPKANVTLVVKDMIKSASDGLKSGNAPVRSREGTGGAYFMQGSSGNKFVGVFKPIDEEPMAENSPQGLPLSPSVEGLKKGTKVGEGALREVAAYILDHPKSGEESGFAGVPPTTMVECLHPGFNHPKGVKTKIGSLQMFTENDGSCEDMGPLSFPVEEVHKISVLDIRLANADRHGGNILMTKDENGKIVLVPIDHGYCLPESFEDCTFEWLYWPQARKPYSAETQDYIRSLDAEEDIDLLTFHGWKMPVETARTLRISTMLLKKGVGRGLTAFEIGTIMCRETLTKKSLLEEMVEEAQEAVLPGTSEDAFLEALSEVMDYHLDEVPSRSSEEH